MGPPATPPSLPEESGLLAESAQEGPPPLARAPQAGRTRLAAAALLLAAALAGAGGGALRRPHAASAAGTSLEVASLEESPAERKLKQRDGSEATMKQLDDQLVEAKQKLATAEARSKEHLEEMKRKKMAAAEALKDTQAEQADVIANARKERDAALKKVRMSLKYAEEREDALKADAEMEREDTVGQVKKKSEMAVREKAATLARTKAALAAKVKAEDQIEQLEEKATAAEEVVKRLRAMVKGDTYTEPADEDEESEEGDDADTGDVLSAGARALIQR
mmetsp:Transcript_93130/g.252646  ORF Transcript_93130/g.252646 Transcript_93130/m.252646 type:complete len:279 (+) Transcript_93130:50-886(+)